MQLTEQTTILLTECDEAINRFYKMRELDAVPDFFGQVKPYADTVHGMLHEWQQQAHAWIRDNQPKYMHIPQIDHAVDAMEQFTVQSFYKETSKKRFIQSVQSVHYTLSTFLRYLKEGEGDAQ
ncbi:YppE family protein [Solibacillus sp. FSL H8-0538]|uniref:YppE family protein n=1 Tax=Solibacillus sp. FSL H8-0538 TaxID=2921400 RepID=UPI0030FA346E